MKRLIKLLVFTLIGVSTLSTLKAAPAYPGIIQQKQSDGTILNYYLFGDEFFSWARTTDEYTIKLNDVGDYVYMVKDSDGDLVLSKVIAHDPESRSKAELLFLSTIEPKMFYSESQMSIVQQAIAIRKAENEKASRAFPTTGNRKLICILIGFTDKAFTKTQAEFNTLFNGTTGSVKHYYLENSYNQFNLTVDVAGPYTASRNMAYYGANDASGNDIRPRELVLEAINLADPHVNFANYDNDNDGWVDGVYIIYAGYGEEAGGGADAIWAHAWSLATAVTKDGVKLQKYSCSAELRGNSGTNITNIGVICHEFGHVLGAPDYYDTDYSTGGQYEGTGSWDMMASGSWNNDGATPAHHNGYTKTKVYNWAPVVTLNQPATVTLQQATFNSNSFYQINTTTANEYFLIENRQQQGFDAYIPGHGMIIYHVHSGVNQVGNKINATHPQRMYPVCASATGDPTSTPSSYGSINSLGCAWPYGTTKTSFTDNTLPSSKSWAGNNTNKPITNIVRNTTNKTVTFNFMGGGGSIYTTTFTVVNAGNTPIAGANIAINSQTLTTNASGVATISLANGTYPYTVSKDGYVNGTGNAVVNGANLSINVTLQDEVFAPYDVEATVINVNQAKVTWDPVFSDDIESYNDFIISNIGNYTLVDVDGSSTYGVQDVSFTNSGYTGSYIVFNPSVATPALSGAWAPHSGNKYLACFAATSPPNNDWLITHQVNVVPGMKFSFWARSLTTQWGADRFKVGVSTTGTAPANFTFLTGSNYIEAPAAWTQYTYNLDAYAGQQIYLAINCVSNDSFVLMVDDIFIGGLRYDGSKAFLGYKVYLNDQVKASGLTTKEYTITNIPAGTHNVGVQAVYSSGSSAIVYADPITINPQYYTVTFKVVDPSNAPIGGASIAINSQTLTTNASGIATISLVNETYPYTISKIGFVNGTGNAVVNGANITINKTLAYQEYSLTLVVNPTSGGTVNDVSGNYHLGDNITVIATPAAGYRFINWTKGGTVVSTNAQFIYTMPSENVTLTANFELIPTYTVTFTVVDPSSTPVSGASIAINSQTLTTNSSGVATISLSNNTYPYTISKVGFVNGTGNAVVNGANITINKTLSYQEYSLTLVANPTSGGTVNDVSGNYHLGDNITVIATPAAGYRFINWTKGGTVVSTNAQFIYTMPSENVTLTANFELIPTYTVTFKVVDPSNTPISGASIAINSQTLTTNASGVATISLANGTYPYTISKVGFVDETGDAIVNGAAVSINKTFAYQDYSLTLVASPSAGGTVNDVSGSYHLGDNITVIATAASGYNFINWTKGGTIVSADAQFVYTMPSEDVTLTANFELIPTYTVTFTVINSENIPIEGATVAINSESLTTNSSGVATISLANGAYPYTISKVGFVDGTGDAVVNGVAVSINKTLAYQDYSLTLVASPSAGGTVNDVSGNYHLGDNITVIATPAAGYNFVNWTKDGVQVSANTQFIYTMPSENVTLTANFALISTYIVTFKVVDFSNTPISDASIAINSQTLTTNALGVATISLANGAYPYTISKVGFVDGTGDAVVNGAAVSINKTLAYQDYSLTLVASPSAGGTVNDVSGNYHLGDNITVIATPAAVYRFINWTKDGVQVSANAQFTYTMPSENVTLTANFELIPTYTVTLTVVDPSSTPISGASIAINSQTLTTNASGVATISLANGTYPYTISKVGFVDETGDAIVNGAAVSINKTLAYQDYSLTLVASPSAGGTVNDVSGDYHMGDNITVIATAASGYNFINWTKDGTIVSADAHFVYTMPSEDVTLTANFELIPTYTVTFTVTNSENIPIEGATVAINSESLTTNSSGVATISLANGAYPYTISKVGFVDGTGDAVVNGAAVSINKTLAYQDYNLTLVASPSAGGTVNEVSGSYHLGDNITVIATAASGYNFINWTKDGTIVSADAEFVYTMPSENVTLTANFELIPTYTVTFTVTNSENIPIEGAIVAINSESLITNSSGVATISLANATYPYTISKVGFVDGTGDAVVNGAAVSINKTLAYQDYSLTLVASPSAGGTVNDVSGSYYMGENITVMATPVDGFCFANWTKDGVEVSADAQFVYTMPSEDVILTANFEITYTVTFKIIFSSGDPIEGVTILVNGEALTTDSSGTATINLPSGEYSFTISGNEYSFIVINEDITVVFVWPSPVFEITFHAAHNGTPLEGVRIHVDGHATTTNAQGDAVAHLANGIYTYTATKEGYNDLEGSFEVNNADQAIVLNMTGIEEAAENFVRIYPNPVESILTIERNSSNEVVIEIYNSGGALVGTTKTEKSITTMDVDKLGVGTYFIRIIGTNNTVVHRFIKR